MAQRRSARQVSRVILWRHLMQQPCLSKTEHYLLLGGFLFLFIQLQQVHLLVMDVSLLEIPFIDSLNCMQRTCISFVYTRFVQVTPVMWTNHMLLWPPLPNILLFSSKCLVNNTFSRKYYRVLVTATCSISMEHWQHDTERGKLQYSENKLSHCHCGHHKSHIDRPRIKSLPLLSERPLINHMCYGMAPYSLL